MEQPTEESGNFIVPDQVCLLLKTIHGRKQAGSISGVLLHQKLTNWGFQQSPVKQILNVLKCHISYIIHHTERRS